MYLKSDCKARHGEGIEDNCGVALSEQDFLLWASGVCYCICIELCQLGLFEWDETAQPIG